MTQITSHIDTFVIDRLPHREAWPDLRFDLSELHYPVRLNAARELLFGTNACEQANHIALRGEEYSWTYGQLSDQAQRVAHVLTRDMGLVAGNRVLLRGYNSPMMVAAWFGVLLAGGVAVTTMALLRSSELAKIGMKAEVNFVLSDHRLAAEVEHAARACGFFTRRMTFGDGTLESRMRCYGERFIPVDTSAVDPAFLAFTSGTTGQPKATIHFHRDVLVMADVVARQLLQTKPSDIYAGSPPLGFTFGLGALLVFPLRFGASAVLRESASARALLSSIETERVTTLFTAPTHYRSLLEYLSEFDISCLNRCVSAGEALPRSLSDAWHEATGLRIIDGLGATEMGHIFISAAGADIRPGSTGRVLPGYEACIVDELGQRQPSGIIGRLAVKGPTGCRYLDDPRQREYVQNGWNITGDLYLQDADDYSWFQARADDMIISAGYNIAGPEVEAVLLTHPKVKECAVVAAMDVTRGSIVKAFIVAAANVQPSADLAAELQEFVKQVLAPYKYPRAIEFIAELPKTGTGKILRFALRTQISGAQPNRSGVE